MTDQRASPDTSTAGPDITDGRYLYCVVDLDEPPRETSLDIDGVDDEPVSIIRVGEQGAADASDDGSIGAVVHACDELYDAADPLVVRRWLVRHQRVVDEATSRFGTPVPFQFDTILNGGDDGVRSWLRDERESLRHALETLAGTQEYRIDVVRTEPIPTATIVDDDTELATLEAEIESASAGRAHLLERQFEQKLAHRRRAHDDQLASELRDRIEPLVSELDALDRRPSVSLGETAEGRRESDDAPPDESDDSSGVPHEPVCRLAVLATDEAIEDVGSLLDDVADRDGITVRFTGPWPPYSFVPSFESNATDPEGSNGANDR